MKLRTAKKIIFMFEGHPAWFGFESRYRCDSLRKAARRLARWRRCIPYGPSPLIAALRAWASR